MYKEKWIDLLKKQRNIEELYNSIDDLKLNVSIPNKPYTIIRDRIYCDDIYEIFIIYWNEDYTSPIHSHAKNGCILYVLDGCLEETVYSDSDITHNKTILPFFITIVYIFLIFIFNLLIFYIITKMIKDDKTDSYHINFVNASKFVHTNIFEIIIKLFNSKKW